MEKDSTIRKYHELLIEVNKERPLKADLEVLASMLAYTVAFEALKGWTVSEKSIEEINNVVLDFVLKGVGLSDLVAKS